MQWNSFKPALLQSLMAESAPNFGGDVKKEKRAMLLEEDREASRSANMADTINRNAEADAQKKQAALVAPIEGESGPQRMTRLQNQAWDPDSYGSKYRAQFKPLSQSPELGAAPSPDTAPDEYEQRRRRRMAQASDMNRDSYE